MKIKRKITLKENFELLNRYSTSFFFNLYNCYIMGIGYDINKHFEKTKYRLQNLFENIVEILKEEDPEKMKQIISEFFFLIKKKRISKRFEFKFKDETHKFEIYFYSYFLQECVCIVLLEKLAIGFFDLLQIEKNIFDYLTDFCWDYQKLLVKVFLNKGDSYKTKPIIIRKKKWKKTKKQK